MKYGQVCLPIVWEVGVASNKSISRICLIPNVSGVGGMVSFRRKLTKGLQERGIKVTNNLADTPYDVILIIGGTRDIAGLWRAKRHGVQIIQRLDGMNWIHRKTRTGWQHYLRAEYGNFILALIRSRLADQIIYQSVFSQRWWERVYSRSHKPCHVVHNGVDLSQYTPDGKGERPIEFLRLLLVEGTIGGGYEMGLRTVVEMAEKLDAVYSRTIEVLVVGRISEALQREWKQVTDVNLKFMGQVAAEKIPEIDRSAHVLYAADLNPACPNSVIEALACGLPVVGFDTGSLAEIITGQSGQLVPYGGDPWKLEPPDIEGLARAVNIILKDQEGYRKGARKRAEEAFGLDRMVEGYLNVLQS
jgi:glycosyltransferase involved in cell wall biosynthesis